MLDDGCDLQSIAAGQGKLGRELERTFLSARKRVQPQHRELIYFSTGLRPEPSTTWCNGCLGSHHDEERSEMRYAVRIAGPRESSEF